MRISYFQKLDKSGNLVRSSVKRIHIPFLPLDRQEAQDKDTGAAIMSEGINIGIYKCKIFQGKPNFIAAI